MDDPHTTNAVGVRSRIRVKKSMTAGTPSDLSIPNTLGHDAATRRVRSSKPCTGSRRVTFGVFSVTARKPATTNGCDSQIPTVIRRSIEVFMLIFCVQNTYRPAVRRFNVFSLRADEWLVRPARNKILLICPSEPALNEI